MPSVIPDPEANRTPDEQVADIITRLESDLAELQRFQAAALDAIKRHKETLRRLRMDGVGK
ncbi:MAG: hypothetical protein ABW194_03080 [Novosphingobium sp.]